MKRKVWFAGLIAAIAVFPFNPALADCRQDPREVHFAKDSAARFKSYLCGFPGAAPGEAISVEFYTFTVESASMIASGHPLSTLSPIFGHFSTVRTKTLDQFKSLVDRFGHRWSLDNGFAEIDIGAKESLSVVDVTKINTTSIDDGFDYPALEPTKLDTRVIPEHMNIFYVTSDALGDLSPSKEGHAIFWRYATLQDIIDYPENAAQMNQAARTKKSLLNSDAFFDNGKIVSLDSYKKYLGLLRFLSGGAELPEEFLILYGYLGRVCGPEDLYWQFKIVSPRVALETMLIRNTSSQDIRVDSLLGEETGDMRLRRSESSVPKSASSATAIGVGAVIRRGEALLVPSRIALRSKVELLSQQVPHQAAEVYQQLVSKGITARPDVYAAPSTPSFAFGPELRIAGMVINGNPIQLSARSSNFVDVSFSTGAGSCPYLLSWDEQRRDWVEHGKVLHQANEQRFESTQTIAMAGFVSRFRLEEREPEVTTLDRAELFLTLRDGQQVAAWPEDRGGRDATPSLVFWGEAQEFAFSLPLGISAEDVTQSRLVLTGYYQRYSSFPNVSRDNGAAFLQATVPAESAPSH